MSHVGNSQYINCQANYPVIKASGNQYVCPKIFSQQFWTKTDKPKNALCLKYVCFTNWENKF